MEKNPDVIARLAAEREDENWRFRTYLRTASRLSEGRVDRLAEKIGRAAEAQMDCTTCGACCRDIIVPVNTEEQVRLARRLGLSPEQFAERYLVTNDDDEPAIEARPCPFLDGNRCSVYEDRPEVCRGYPYVGGNIRSRMIGIIERAETCPIIFHMLEELKDAVGFRRFR